MEQNHKGSYRTNESIIQEFLHSCLGRLVILAAVFGVLLIVAAFTVPDDEVMAMEMEDNIRQCIEANDSIKTDWIDDAVNNVGNIFTHASTDKEEVMASFHKFNVLEIRRNKFYATAVLRNNLKPEGICAGIGIFGMVIPTVSFNDILLRTGPMHKGYEQKIKRTIIKETEYFGSNPELGY